MSKEEILDMLESILMKARYYEDPIEGMLFGITLVRGNFDEIGADDEEAAHD